MARTGRGGGRGAKAGRGHGRKKSEVTGLPSRSGEVGVCRVGEQHLHTRRQQ